MSVVNFGHDLEKKNGVIIGLLLDCAWYENITQTEADSGPVFITGSVISCHLIWKPGILHFRGKRNSLFPGGF